MKIGKNKTIIFLAIMIIFTFMAVPVQATIIQTYTDRISFDAAFPTPSFFEGWDALASGTQILNGNTYNGVVYNSNSGGVQPISGFYATTLPNVLTRLNDGSGFVPGDSVTMTFSFAVRAFGVDLNTYSVVYGAYIATTSSGDVAFSYYDPYSAITTGQFIGFITDAPFTSITITNPETGNYGAGLDSMRVVAAVPEPTTMFLLGCGLLGLWGFRKKFKK